MYRMLNEEWNYQDLEGKFQKESQFISEVIGGDETCICGCNQEAL